MAMTERRAKDLAYIEPPRSVVRVSNFLRDLTRSGMPTLNSFTMGGGAMMALAGRAPFFPGGGFLEAFQRLTAHYAVQAEDLEAFAHWLVLWVDKYTEMEVIEDPTVYDAPAFAPKPRPVPVALPPVDEAPFRRTRRRDDPPRPPSEKPRLESVAEEPPPEPSKPAKGATFRPAKREPVPEPPEPPKRIDLATLARRSQFVGFGSGMMIGGAALAPGQVAPGQIAQGQIIQGAEGMPLAQPFAPAPSGPEVSVHRTVVVDRAQGSPPYSQSPAPSQPFVSRGGVSSPAATSSSPQQPHSRRYTDDFQADEPDRPLSSGLSDGSTYIETPVRPGITGAEAPPITPEAAVASLRARPDFPSVKAILIGAATLAPALASAFGFPSRRPHSISSTLDDGPLRPAPEMGHDPTQTQEDGEERSILGRSHRLGAPQTFGDPTRGDGSARPSYGHPIQGGRSDRPSPIGLLRSHRHAAFAAGPSGQWIAHTNVDDGFDSRSMDLPSEEIRIDGTGEPGAVRARGERPIPTDPRYGQITLIAPPLAVASAQGERAGSAVQFEWAQLAENAGELDAGGLGRLATMLPQGAQAIYPALPAGMRGAANLKLGPSLLGQLLERGYGPQASRQASAIAAATPGGSSRAASPIAASLVPIGRPAGANAEGGVLGGSGALADAGGASATRGGALDFLGVPVRLAPNLGGRPELKQQQTVETAGADLAAGRPVRPEAFAPLQKRLFPNLQSVSVEPDAAKWRKAAPSFGMRGADPTTVLSADATAKPPSAAGPRPASLETPKSPAGALRNLIANPPAPTSSHAPAALGDVSVRPSPFRAREAMGDGSVHPLPFRSHAMPGDGSVRPAAAPWSPGFSPRPPSTSPLSPLAPSNMGTRAPAMAAPRTFRPISQPGPPGAGRTTATSAPSALGGGHLPAVERPADAPSAPAMPSFPAIGSPSVGKASTLPGVGLTPPRISFGSPVSSRSAPPRSLPVSVATVPSIRTLSVAPVPVHVNRPTPEMLYSAAPARPAARTMAIQRSEGYQPLPASNSPGKRAERAPSSDEQDGTESAEVNSLATEVWSLLKRRLANEAERRGRF